MQCKQECHPPCCGPERDNVIPASDGFTTDILAGQGNNAREDEEYG
jgi:hypothetical protein